MTVLDCPSTPHREQGYGLDEVRRMLRAAGLRPSYRQIDDWTRKGYVRVPARTKVVSGVSRGSGVSRTWPASEVAILAAIYRLTKAGWHLETAAAAARAGEPARSLTTVLPGGITVHLDAGTWAL